MATIPALLFLLCAALLEVGGDALVRSGLNQSKAGLRAILMAAGGVVLFAYGCMVNFPRWQFGRLLGIYISLFFVVSQALAWLVFGERPNASVWLGGSLILLGACVIAFNAR